MRIPEIQKNKPKKMNANQDPPGNVWSIILKIAITKKIIAASTQRNIAIP